ncbi:MAG: protease inhibitor I42 family protein [Elusimicrobia bacterium]|nr:protease inhibitor I42 family protein [Elusimicrobiota bacterium]
MMRIFASSAALTLFCAFTTSSSWAQAQGKPGSAAAGLIVGEKALATQAHLPVGRTLIVRLPGNPTTGFGWEVAGGTGTVAVLEGSVSYESAPHRSGIVGSGGTFTSVFKAAAAGRTVLRLEYRRPWEKGVAPAKTFSVEMTAFAGAAALDEKAANGALLVPKGAEIMLRLAIDDETLTQEMIRPKGAVAFVDSDFRADLVPGHLYRFRAEEAGEDEIRVRFRRDGPVTKVIRDYRVAVRVY